MQLSDFQVGDHVRIHANHYRLVSPKSDVTAFLLPVQITLNVTENKHYFIPTITNCVYTGWSCPCEKAEIKQ